MLRSHFGPIAIAAFFAVTAHSSVSHATIYTIDVGSYARSGLGDRLSSGFDIVNLGARTFSLDLTENVATTALLNPVTFTVGVNVPAATPAFTEFFTANRFITVNSGWSSLLSQFYSVTIATTDTIAFGASGNTSINMGARGIIDVAPQAMTISSAQIGTSTGNVFGTVTLRNFNKTWNGATSGSWSSGARWAQGFAPMSDQTATFASAGTYSVALDPAATAKNVTIGAGNVTFDAGATGSLAIVNELRVDGAAGTAANLRGTVSAGITYVGFNNAGQLNVQGGSFASADHIYLGRNGSGSIAQADGTVTVSNGNHLWLGFDTTGKGGYGLYGGMLNVTGSEFIGESGQGTFAQLAGTHVVGGSVRIGDANGSTGTMNVSGGTLVAGGMYVGGDLTASHGTGTLTVSDTADVTINGTTKLRWLHVPHRLRRRHGE